MNSWWLRPPSADEGGNDDKTTPESGSPKVGESEPGAPPRRRRRRARRAAGDPNEKREAAAEKDEAEVPESASDTEEKDERPAEPRPPRKPRRKQAEKKDRDDGGGKAEPAENGDEPLRWQEQEAPSPRFHQIFREGEMPVGTQVLQAGPERRLALFCDLENLALGVRDSQVQAFDIHLVLERLLEKGRIIVKKAYCDWERYSDYKRPFHEAAIEMIDIPHRRYSGKNSADIKMVVDAMDLSYSKEHLDTFVILSGDSDFSPLVSKLRENNKFVIGVGVKNSTSPLLIDNCDEFIYYEDVWRDVQRVPKVDGFDKKQAEVFSLLIDAILALLRENREVLWGSMIKQTMQRKRPSFSESYFGYSSFSEVLEAAEEKGLIKLKRDPRSGSYVVTGFAEK